MRNALPRDLPVATSVQSDYQTVWDRIAAEPPGPEA
jgi:hypothetical protein